MQAQAHDIDRGSIDLNCDLGEARRGTPRWAASLAPHAGPDPDDAALLAVVTSANVACGFHAGNRPTMNATVVAAAGRGVAVGAHPSYRDAENFGRVDHDLGREEVARIVAFQLIELDMAARRHGSRVRYVKPHGALYNRIVHDREQAAGVVDAVLAYAAVADEDPLPILGLPGAAVLTEAEKAGADGLLVVTPYYSKPPQAAIAEHMRTVADATELPVMLYDIPGRSGVPIDTETLLRLAEHPRILAVKDAKGDLVASQRVMTESSLVYYSGEDALNLPLMAFGAVGIVSVVGHVSADKFASMVAAVGDNDLDSARRIAGELAPLVDAIMNHLPGVVAVKAALELQGVIPTRATRMPLLPAADEQVESLRAQLIRSGYLQ